MSQILPEQQLSRIERGLGKAAKTTIVELAAGGFASIDGFLYKIERANPPLFSIKFKGVDPQEQRPKEHRRRFKVKDTLHIGGQKYKVLSSSCQLRFFIRLIK